MEYYADRRVLITEGRGYIVSNLARCLFAGGSQIKFG
jgi:hypothetical protein